jgi:hypothetical protein
MWRYDIGDFVHGDEMRTTDGVMLFSISSSYLYYIITDTVCMNVVKLTGAKGIAFHASNTVLIIILIIILNFFSPISY